MPYFRSSNQLGFAPLFIVLIVGSIVLAGGLIFYFSRSSSSALVSKPGEAVSTPMEVPHELPSISPGASVGPLPSGCGKDCQAYIDLRLDTVKKDLLKQLSASALPSSTAVVGTPIPQASAAVSAPKEYYISLGGGASTTSTAFVDIQGSDFKFDPGNYPGARAFYFQAILVSDAPDKETFARLYDITHNVGIINSDIKYKGLSPSLTESGALNFFAGVLTLRVQVHGLDINSASVLNPRIKVVY